MKGNETNYLVRTFCATYNQENYIRDALKGFVIQETTFPVVYTIVDDASTDNNAVMIRDFVSENFDLEDSLTAYDKDTDYGHVTYARHKTNINCYFAVVYLKENHYQQRKSRFPYLTDWLDTKYLAYCEGDDYWTDPKKLQKQVEFLETNLEYDLCCGASQVYIQKGKCFSTLKGSDLCEKYSTIVEDYNDINTATVLVRNDAMDKCIKELSTFLPPYLFFDTAYWYWFAYYGKTKYMSEPMAVYRVLENSASHSTDREKGFRRDLNFLRLKLEFLLRYPLSEGQEAVVDNLIQTIEGLCGYSRHLGELTVRKSGSYKVGSNIKRLLKWKNKRE